MTNPSQDIRVRFGERLRALRRERSMSQDAFASACGLDRTYLGGIERGERNVSIVNLKRIADALGISLSTLLDSL